LDSSQKRLACLIHDQDGPDLLLMFNADTEPASFVLPSLPPGGGWQIAIDTEQPSLGDEAVHPDPLVVQGTRYGLGPRASAILVARS
jgi:hypothetical protein